MERLGDGSPFLSRGSELEALVASIDECSRGRTIMVLIGGESGVGKSRLVAEAARQVEHRVQVLSGSAIDIAEKRPFWPIIDALRHLLDGESEAGRAAAAVQPWRAALETLLCTTIAADDDSTPGRSADTIGSVADLPEVELLSQVLAALARNRPVVLVIEDLQWADHSTRDFLVYALANLVEVPLIFVATYRTDALSRAHPLRQLLPELQRNRRVRATELAPADESTIAALVAGAIGERDGDGAHEVQRLVWARSEGNFFLAEETLRALRSGANDEVPLTLRQIVLGRIDGMSQPVHEVLHAIATADEPISHALLAAVTELDDSTLIASVREAVDASILVADRAREVYRFRHALYKEVIAADLLPGELQRLHRRFAGALATTAGLTDPRIAGRLAHHWDRAGEWALALESTAAAAEDALTAHGYAEAHAHWMRSLQLVERIAPKSSPLDRDLLLERAAESATLTGEHAEAVALMQERISSGVDLPGVEAARLHQLLARYLAATGSSKAALEAHANALALLPPDADAAVRASVLNGLANALMISGQYGDARATAQQAATLAQESGASSEQARALAILGFSLAHLENPSAGIEVLEKSLSFTEELGSAADIGAVLVSLAELHAGPLNRLDEAVVMARDGAERARALGLERTTGVELRAVAANALFRLGRWAEAGAELGLALGSKPTGSQAIELRLARARLLVGWGNIEEAEDELEALDTLLAESIRPRDRVPLLTLRAGLALWMERTDIACDAVIAGLDSVNVDSDDVWLIAPLVWHGLRAIGDDVEHARDRDRRTREDSPTSVRGKAEIVFVERMRALAARIDAAPDAVSSTINGYLLLCAGELSRSRREPDPEIWLRSAGAWEDLGHPYPTAYSLFRHADALFARRARAVGALKALRRSHEIASALGARPLLEQITSLATRARVSLAQSPASNPAEPRDASRQAAALSAPYAETTADSSALAALSQRELMVLAEIAEGRTNREIAQQLFISEKTVSAHVTHILTKLGVHSRVRASTLFIRATTTPPQPTTTTGAHDGH